MGFHLISPEPQHFPCTRRTTASSFETGSDESQYALGGAKRIFQAAKSKVSPDPLYVVGIKKQSYYGFALAVACGVH